MTETPATTTTQVLRRSADYLARHGVESPRETAEALIMHVLGTDRAGLYSGREHLDSARARLLGRALCQRCSGVPLQYLTREQRFLDLDLAVEPGVFVPRPETEGLVLATLETIAAVADPVVVDVGTGTGAVALAVKSRRPSARVVATDRSAAAVRLARSNASTLGLAIDVRRGDLLDPVPGALRGRVDLLVSNPPYVTPEEYEALPGDVKAEPYEALVGGTDVHARLVAAAPSWLRPGGWLVMEIGEAQATAVLSMVEGAGFAEVRGDLAGRDRVVRVRFDDPR